MVTILVHVKHTADLARLPLHTIAIGIRHPQRDRRRRPVPLTLPDYIRRVQEVGLHRRLGLEELPQRDLPRRINGLCVKRRRTDGGLAEFEASRVVYKFDAADR